MPARPRSHAEYQTRPYAPELDGLRALADAASPPEWLSVRNASDPQMDGPDLATETAQAAAIYEKYGQITSWGSALVCWALIANRAVKSLHGARLQRTLVIPTQEAPWPHR